MIRLIIRHDDAAMAANLGGAVLTRYQTMDIDLPALETALTSGGFGENGYAHTQLIGCEVLQPKGEG